MNDTYEEVKSLMVGEFQIDPQAITPETELSELGVDSLAALEFVFVLEEKFDFTMDERTDLRGGVVQDVVNAVNLALSRQPVATGAI
jgi:acyl carrier protein